MYGYVEGAQCTSATVTAEPLVTHGAIVGTFVAWCDYVWWFLVKLGIECIGDARLPLWDSDFHMDGWKRRWAVLVAGAEDSPDEGCSELGKWGGHGI